MPSALVVGASRGLGLELAKKLTALKYQTFATVRSSVPQDLTASKANVIKDVDLAHEDAGAKIVKGLNGEKLDLVLLNAGVLKPNTIDDPKYDDQVEMYKVVAIAPVVVAHNLWKADALKPGSKFILITTEGASITLRTREEGGGAHGHHGSKAAANMVGKLLSIDFHDKGITVAMIHPGFMRTEMTKSVGFDKFYDEAGAVEPSVAAESTLEFVDKLTHDQTGTFWAPRGPEGIGEAERVLGKGLPTPLQLPW